MSYRITQSDLETLAHSINVLLDAPQATIVRTDESNQFQVGNYYISYAYGGASLYCVVNEQGGARDVLGCGHVAKRELHNRMCAYAQGIRDVQICTALSS